jgi:hypothetical protein
MMRPDPVPKKAHERTRHNFGVIAKQEVSNRPIEQSRSQRARTVAGLESISFVDCSLFPRNRHDDHPI